MNPFSIRSIVEQLDVTLGRAERQEPQTTFREDGFELFALPVVAWKMYKQPRDLDNLDFIVSHVTAVKGGFGVSGSKVKAWDKRLREGTVHDALMIQLARAGAVGVDTTIPEAGDNVTLLKPRYIISDEQRAAVSRRLALWERYRAGVPYHQIGAANGDNLANRELRHVTWHGSLGNFGVGWSLDVGASEVLKDWHIETGRAALRTLCKRILEVSSKARRDGIRVAPHRAFSPARFGDTGANVHREIIIPTAKEVDALSIDYTMVKGKGRPIPRSWDPDALFDDKGRRIQ